MDRKWEKCFADRITDPRKAAKLAWNDRSNIKGDVTDSAKNRYIKALIKRQHGEIQESLQLFQMATCLNPRNPANLKQAPAPRLYTNGSNPANLYMGMAQPCKPATRHRLWGYFRKRPVKLILDFVCILVIAVAY